MTSRDPRTLQPTPDIPPSGQAPPPRPSALPYAAAYAAAPPAERVGARTYESEDRASPAEVTLADLQPLRWGPIVAGTLTAVGIFILASLLAIAVGVQAAPGVEAIEDMDIIGVLVTSIIALGSFFVGGFVSSWTAGISGQGRSLVNGFLVWTLWLVSVAILAALGIGTIAGAMGELFGQTSTPSPDVETSVLLEAVQQASWASFLALSLTALASMLGAVVGAREDLRGVWNRVGARRLQS